AVDPPGPPPDVPAEPPVPPAAPPPPPQAAIDASASAASAPLIGPRRVITAHECRERAGASLESKVVDQEARGPLPYPRPAPGGLRQEVDQHHIGCVAWQSDG